MSGDLKGYPMQGVYTGYGREVPVNKCDCGAPRDGKWAGIHEKGCASLVADEDKSLLEWIKEEREACAKIAEDAPVYGNKQIAALIRARK